MRRLATVVVTVLLSMLGSTSLAWADGEQDATIRPPTSFMDRDGNVWPCIEWNDKGCNTGRWYHEPGSSTNWVLWISPDGHHQWRETPLHVTESDNRYEQLYTSPCGV